AVLEDPSRATALPGAQGAAARINATLAEQAEHLSQTGRQVKQSAYDVQHQAWSRQTVADGAARLAQAKALSANRFSPTNEDVARLFQTAAALRADAAAVEVVGSGFTPAIDHALALAALAILGRADQEDIKAASLLREPEGAGCMQMSKLNLYQCLAVAGPHYEDIFCLGEHALKETGQCLRQVAGAPVRASAIPRVPVANDYAVPVAYASVDPR
ncbi:MAG: hypothetical protein P4L64_04360, partial [Caulobacteraceae bacterium]|nr:hypothetical protein [Caulobacteraceae bacterium]